MGSTFALICWVQSGRAYSVSLTAQSAAAFNARSSLIAGNYQAIANATAANTGSACLYSYINTAAAIQN